LERAPKPKNKNNGYKREFFLSFKYFTVKYNAPDQLKRKGESCMTRNPPAKKAGMKIINKNRYIFCILENSNISEILNTKIVVTRLAKLDAVRSANSVSPNIRVKNLI
jgi:hypothetical protein